MRGRRKLAVEKSPTYTAADVIHGRNPAARGFADDVAWFAFHKGKPRSTQFRDWILARLAVVGASPVAQQAAFFRDVADYLLLCEKLPASGVFDIRRFLLRSILMLEYRDKPVDLTKVAAQITSEGGIPCDERFVSRECKKLGFVPRRRGRP